MAFRERHPAKWIPHFHAWHERKKGIKGQQTPLITPDTRIATIGSCFAQEIADAMDRLGLKGAMNPSGLVYNTRAIKQELL